jgi:hypothetical protein
VPKSHWNKTNPADANNLIDIAARCLLIEDDKRLILLIQEWELSNQKILWLLFALGITFIRQVISRTGVSS